MPKKSEFQVHMAAGRRTRKTKPAPAPVKVIRANPEALKTAHGADQR